MANSFQSAFFKLIHEINLGGQFGVDTQVVQSIKTSFEHIFVLAINDVVNSVGDKNFLYSLQIPPFSETDIGVPVD